MRLHVLSDLHLEHRQPPPARVDADAIVLAGDIATGTDGIEWAREWSGGVPTFYVAGNHEFYRRSLPGLIDELRRAAEGSSVHVLEDDEVVLDGVRLLGCTLWSDFEFDGPDQRQASMRLCERVVNDYSQITLGSGERRLAPADTLELHLASRRWLSQRLAQPDERPTVVITHHQPVIVGKPEQETLRLVAGAFASDLSELMDGRRTPLWIYGHTHRAADLRVHGTRVISNPAGYPHQPVDGYDAAMVVELSGETPRGVSPSEKPSASGGWTSRERP
jgi:predicted phosphodiesterase